uniref:Secreted protein n=1 Tax=Anopheles darlingi TaxID=43151 RepID=A0A2M4DBX8_ANODA
MRFPPLFSLARSLALFLFLSLSLFCALACNQLPSADGGQKRGEGEGEGGESPLSPLFNMIASSSIAAGWLAAITRSAGLSVIVCGRLFDC